MSKIVLYSYFRSSCSWRVRCALALKGIDYEYKAVNLLKGEQLQDSYKELNPQGLIPALVHNGHTFSQSISIIEYLDEQFPDPPLLPRDDAVKRADVKRLALMIAADIQPLQNLRVLNYVGNGKKAEFAKWVIENGFVAMEKALEKTAGKYCYGDEITLPDLCLVPQVFNASRFKVNMSQFPIINRVEASLSELEAFKQTHPIKQPDCPEDFETSGR